MTNMLVQLLCENSTYLLDNLCMMEQDSRLLLFFPYIWVFLFMSLHQQYKCKCRFVDESKMLNSTVVNISIVHIKRVVLWNICGYTTKDRMLILSTDNPCIVDLTSGYHNFFRYFFSQEKYIFCDPTYFQ